MHLKRWMARGRRRKNSKSGNGWSAGRKPNNKDPRRSGADLCYSEGLSLDDSRGFSYVVQKTHNEWGAERVVSTGFGSALATALQHRRILAGFFGGSFGRQRVHLLADVRLVDGKLDPQVDDVTGTPVERQA